jgi:hypothetical protein
MLLRHRTKSHIIRSRSIALLTQLHSHDVSWSVSRQAVASLAGAPKKFVIDPHGSVKKAA